MTTTITGQPIYSTFGDDADMAELVEMFVEEMPARITSLEEAFAGRDRETLHRLAHQMKGAGGSYGFAQLTPYAKAVESAARDGETEDRLQVALDDLIAACKLVRAGTASTAP